MQTSETSPCIHVGQIRARTLQVVMYMHTDETLLHIESVIKYHLYG